MKIDNYMIDLSNHNEHSDCSHYIYITLDKRTGKYYIGQHKCSIVGRQDYWYYGSGMVMKNIYNKRGKNDLLNIPIWWCRTQEETDQYEMFFIDYFNAIELGYNIDTGGNSWVNLIGSKNPMFGKRHTEESKSKMREKATGRVAWNKGKKCVQIVGMKGKCHTDESKKKMRDNHADFHGSKSARWKGTVCAYKDDVLVGKFNSLCEIQDFLQKYNKAVVSGVCDCVNGKHKQAYGYQWKRIPTT